MASLSSVPQSDVFRSVVVGIHFVAALCTTELFAVAIVLMCEPTVRPRTALGRVVRLDLFDRHTMNRGFVLDVFEESPVRV